MDQIGRWKDHLMAVGQILSMVKPAIPGNVPQSLIDANDAYIKEIEAVSNALAAAPQIDINRLYEMSGQLRQYAHPLQSVPANQMTGHAVDYGMPQHQTSMPQPSGQPIGSIWPQGWKK